ncbi:hypothetical protein [Hymenobacter sp. BRD67]|uniref:hypothetical protein n=1 Tax=Hymenobacter sp. BRD67 TaxID=2675877 RepID=UPI001565B74C|nr:hypothetical protein [Hymenobacter sp. BRD67]QKG53625.1 hypothetical protein GKZ67_14730 [Hymenobacter sp. BRD67]
MENKDDRPLNDGFSDDYVPRRFREGAANNERRAGRPASGDDRRRTGSNDGASRARPSARFMMSAAGRSRPTDRPKVGARSAAAVPFIKSTLPAPLPTVASTCFLGCAPFWKR